MGYNFQFHLQDGPQADRKKMEIFSPSQMAY